MYRMRHHALCLTFQITVRAVDSVYPNNPGSCTLSVPVNRNPAAPVFQPSNAVFTIPDTTPIGEEIYDVNATDADGVSLLIHSIIRHF